MKKTIRPIKKTYTNIRIYKGTNFLLDELVKELDLNKVIILRDAVDKFHEQYCK